MKTCLVLLILLAGCAQPRYVNQVNLPDKLYTLDVDPNDGIYGGMIQPPAGWVRVYGNSERSLLLYNMTALIQDQRILNEKLKDPNE